MIIEVEWDTDDDEVKKALNYLVGFKEEMTSDKKHYTGVLIREVKRLREENKRLREMVEKAVGYGAYDEEYLNRIIGIWGEEE